MEPGLAKQIKEAILKLREDNRDGKQILRSMDSSYTGFVSATDKDYDSVRIMLSKVAGF
jgi:ABC-type phosphate/phosphonate transport system substrate-binding protein